VNNYSSTKFIDSR